MISTSPTPCALAARTTCSPMACASTGISAPDFDPAEARRARPVARAHHLLGLALAAIGDAPQGPMLGPGDGRAGVPALRGNAAVAGILQHADTLAAAHLPADLAAELEVVALVVDRPASVGLHVNGMVGSE